MIHSYYIMQKYLLTLILPTFQNYEIYQGGAESAPPYYFKK